MKFLQEEIKKNLIIKPRGIGDIVLSTILLENLHNYFPGVKIDYLTEPFAKPAVENNPLVNKVLTIGKKDLPFSVAFRIRKERYDLIIDAWSNPRTALITFLSGVKYRVGFAYKGRKYAYNIPATSERGSKQHSAEHNLELLYALNIPIVSKNIHYYVEEKEDLKAKKFVKENFPSNGLIIGIIPSGGWESKRCDKEKWVEICKAISEKYNCNFLILWGPGDEDDANYIRNALPQKAILSHETGIKELAALIKNCDLIIANDSGPMHIAAALNIPTFGLFGPTNPKEHSPYGDQHEWARLDELFCIQCNLLKCPYNHECFKDLPIERVLHKLDKLIKKNSIQLVN